MFKSFVYCSQPVQLFLSSLSIKQKLHCLSNPLSYQISREAWVSNKTFWIFSKTLRTRILFTSRTLVSSFSVSTRNIFTVLKRNRTVEILRCYVHLLATKYSWSINKLRSETHPWSHTVSYLNLLSKLISAAPLTHTSVIQSQFKGCQLIVYHIKLTPERILRTLLSHRTFSVLRDKYRDEFERKEKET